METIGLRGRDDSTLKAALAKQVEEIRRVAASQAQARNLFNFYDERLEVGFFSASTIIFEPQTLDFRRLTVSFSSREEASKNRRKIGTSYI